MILNTALENNRDLVVLRAYGCGAFGNDPTEKAGVFKRNFKRKTVYQQRMEIVFGILSDKNDSNGNINGFLPLNNFAG